MTTTKEPASTATGKLSLADVLAVFTRGATDSLRFTAYDGSSAGAEDAVLGMDLLTPRGTTYLATAPGELGLARAYVAGDIEARGVHPGDPYDVLKLLAEKVEFTRPSPRLMASIIRAVGIEHLLPAAPPPQEMLPRWRRIAEG
ncbi:MAG TPA: SAM-dependent methyltransferase, partial [Mycobacterium sp.]|nr:SAM-dependent methyltransferase [Mycobacterium sp.]